MTGQREQGGGTGFSNCGKPSESGTQHVSANVPQGGRETGQGQRLIGAAPVLLVPQQNPACVEFVLFGPQWVAGQRDREGERRVESRDGVRGGCGARWLSACLTHGSGTLVKNGANASHSVASRSAASWIIAPYRPPTRLARTIARVTALRLYTPAASHRAVAPA